MPRGNPNNLVKNSDWTPEERREKAARAGRASAEARRKKKNLQEIAKAVMNAELSDKQRRQLEGWGLDPDEVSQWTLAVVGILKKAQVYGDVKCFEKLQELTGELVKSNSTEEERQQYFLGAVRAAIEGAKNDN